MFPRILAKHAEDFALPLTRFNNGACCWDTRRPTCAADKSKAGTGRRSLGGVVSEEVGRRGAVLASRAQTQCYTLEVSMFYYVPQRDAAPVPYTPALYQRLGAPAAPLAATHPARAPHRACAARVLHPATRVTSVLLMVSLACTRPRVLCRPHRRPHRLEPRLELHVCGRLVVLPRWAAAHGACGAPIR